MSRASQYQRFGMPKQAQPGTLAYYMQQTGGNAQQARAELEAQKAGFSSAAAQQANRQMRNQLEMKAAMTNTPIAEAYGMVQGDLTNTQALQDAWNRLTIKPAAQQQTQQAATTLADVVATNVDKDRTQPSAADTQAADLRNSIADLTKSFTDQLTAQRVESERLAAEQAKRFETLQNQFQAQTQMMQRPDVMGVKTAAGSSGDAMQIARRGVRGAFGRTGLRISSLNV